MINNFFPVFPREPKYINPQDLNMTTIFYSNFFLEFEKSCSLCTNKDEILCGNDEPQKFITICRIFEILTEISTIEVNQNELIMLNIVPLYSIILRNISHIESIYYHLQLKVLMYLIALLQGPNIKCVKQIESLADPSYLLDSMFSHFKKLYLFIILNGNDEKTKNIIFEEFVKSTCKNSKESQSDSVRRNTAQLADNSEAADQLSQALNSVGQGRYSIGVKKRSIKNIFKSESKVTLRNSKENMFNVDKGNISELVHIIRKPLLKDAANKIIPKSLENCLDLAIKLVKLEELWLMNEEFLQHLLYKMSLKYFQV